MLYADLIALVGNPPPGCEALAYLLSYVLLTVLVMSGFYLLASVIKWIGGR